MNAWSVTITNFFARFRKSDRALSGLPFFHMEILRVRSNSSGVVIETTGARYELAKRGLTLIRRVDPRTNTVNPRIVGKLHFREDIGALRVSSADRRSCVVESKRIRLEFHCDALFFICSRTNQPFEYEHANAIANAPWNKSGVRREDVPNPETSPFLSRMWTDGYGGSLHAYAEGAVEVVSHTKNQTRFVMTSTGKMAHAVFPPRFFDFESFYGNGARPHVWFVTGADSEANHRALKRVLTDPATISLLDDHAFGYIVLWNRLYSRPDEDYHLPVPITHPIASVGYEFAKPEFIKSAIDKLHARGFNVLIYMHPGFLLNQNGAPRNQSFANQQSMKATLAWMVDFQKEYGYDGYYLDYAGYGGFGGRSGPWRDNWLATYQFIRAVREQIGDNGYLYHHNSIDVWGAYEGLRAIMIDTYCNAQLAGETTSTTSPVDSAIVHHPDEKNLRFYSCGYGLSQTIGSHIRMRVPGTSERAVAISTEESVRAMAESLNCMERTGSVEQPIYQASYERRKATYSTAPDVQWPPYWFARITDASVQRLSTTSIRVTWTTSEPANSSVAYPDDQGVWWRVQNQMESLANEMRDNTLTTAHSITLIGLTPARVYQLRIRSSNLRAGLDERIWGEVIGYSLSA